MENHPKTAFSVKDLKQARLWKTLFSIQPKENAVIALNNLLATRNLQEISPSDIRKISSEYNVNFRKQFLSNLIELYKKFLLFCLTDKFLSNQEVQELKSLKSALGLTDIEVGKIHDEVTSDLYKMEVQKAIEDRRLSDDEKLFLQKVQHNLKICDSLAKEIYLESANDLINKVMNEALSDNLLSDEEELELEETRKSLNVETFLEGSARGNYEKCKLFWQIENGKLPIFVTDLFLDEEEPCHFYTKAEWLEQRISEKHRNNCTIKSKAGNGIYWKTENKEMKPELEDIWATMDNGKIYITKNRLILAGNEEEKSVSLQDIMVFTAFKNGINIIGREKSIFVQFRDHVDIFAVILGKTISNSMGGNI